MTGWEQHFAHTQTVLHRRGLRGTVVPDQRQNSAGRMEFATILVQNYQYDPATVKGFARLACSNRSLLQQYKEDTLVSSTMQQDLSRRRLESSHKLLVIDYVHDHLDNVCHLEEKDQVLAAFKQNLATVAGPLNVRLNFQVDCPDCYRQHKHILDDFTACVGETSGNYDMQWSTKCINILRNLPYDCH